MTAEHEFSYKSVKMHYISYVPEDCDLNLPPVIFLHGLLASSITWNKVKCKIADLSKRKVITVDLRNHGKSEWSEEFSLQNLVFDLKHFMSLHSITQAVLIGHSLGGRVAACFALMNPEKVEKIVVEESTLVHIPDGTVNLIKSSLRTLLQYLPLLPADLTEKDAHSLIARYLNRNLPQDFFQVPDNGVFLGLNKDKNGKFYTLFNAQAVLKSFQNDEFFDLKWTDMKTYVGPALFIYSKHSTSQVEKDKENIMNYFPEARMQAIQGSSHYIHTEHSDRYVKYIVDFIQS